MPVSQSLLVALFCMLVVFAVLGVVYLLMVLFSKIVGKIAGSGEHKQSNGSNV